jgi:hypothetical protein
MGHNHAEAIVCREIMRLSPGGSVREAFRSLFCHLLRIISSAAPACWLENLRWFSSEIPTEIIVHYRFACIRSVIGVSFCRGRGAGSRPFLASGGLAGPRTEGRNRPELAGRSCDNARFGRRLQFDAAAGESVNRRQRTGHLAAPRGRLFPDPPEVGCTVHPASADGDC